MIARGEAGEAKELRIGVLASGGGTTLQAILDAIGDGTLPARVCIVISNNSRCGALERATRAGVPTAHLSAVTHPDPRALDLAIAEALQASGATLIFLAGYMKKLGATTLSRFRSRILNTHPALLPKFGGQGMYGAHVHRAVLAAKEATTGASVHLVTSDYDTGPVLAQTEVGVLPEDSVEALAERVQAAERKLVVGVLARLANGELELADPAP